MDVAVALVAREGRYFLQRRDPASAHLPGHWEFPGGKVEEGEGPEASLRRELGEELGWEPSRCEPLPALTHAYPERTVTLHPFRCEGEGALCTELGWGWFAPAEMRRLRIPVANGPLIDLLDRAE